MILSILNILPEQFESIDKRVLFILMITSAAHVQTIKSIAPSFADWMVSVNYEIENNKIS